MPKLDWIQGENALGAEANGEMAVGRENIHERGFVNWNYKFKKYTEESSLGEASEESRKPSVF